MQRRKSRLDMLTFLLMAMTLSSGLVATVTNGGMYRLIAALCILLATLLLLYRVWTSDGAPEDRSVAH